MTGADPAGGIDTGGPTGVPQIVTGGPAGVWAAAFAGAPVAGGVVVVGALGAGGGAPGACCAHTGDAINRTPSTPARNDCNIRTFSERRTGKSLCYRIYDVRTGGVAVPARVD